MTIGEMEAQRIESLAAQYRSRGYEVHLHPDRELLPSFLAGFSPDMIALSPVDNVVIQVKTPATFDAEQVEKLAGIVQGQRPWRYEVALINLPNAPDVPAQEELAPEEHVAQLIRNAELLASQDQVEAAALLVWSAIETILRRRARTAAPELERQSSARVLKHLYSLGQIQRDLYETLSQLMEFRNAIAHGFTPRVTPPDLSGVISDVRRMQAAA